MELVELFNLRIVEQWNGGDDGLVISEVSGVVESSTYGGWKLER